MQPARAVELWLARPDLSDADRGRLEAVLTPDELARVRRFAFDHSRRQSLAARALLRYALSRSAPIAPADWRFAVGPHGKPELAPDQPPLRFNVSHTDGLVACAVTRGAEVGVDVEPAGRRVNLGMARRYFSPVEADALEALPEAERPARFLMYWTLKEAYVKARGAGLSLPLDGFKFGPVEPVTIAFAPGFGDDPAGWRFFRPDVGPDHVCAVAMRGEVTGVTVRWWDLAF